jgi:SAM-dependent methyltransferase
VTAPFDALASRYGELWSDAPRGREQRAAVWREIDGLFRPGDRVLDLGCGTGDDAAHLASLGVCVTGIDSSHQMVEIARSRGVDARLGDIAHANFGSAEFSGAISNFGALNCVPDLRPIAETLASAVCPGGPVAVCLMGRLCLTDLRHMLRRLRGHATWRGIDVYYPASRQVRQAFDRWFAFEKRVSIGRGDHHLHIFRRRPK